MKITLEELAKMANVSISTVSNALNGKGKVSEEKKGKIISLAIEMNYPFEERNQEKKEKKMPGQIGVIFPSHSNAQDRNYYISEVLVGVEERIKEEGFSIMIESYQNNFPDLAERQMDGLLLIGGQFPEEFILQLAQRECPFVSIGTYTTKMPTNSVVADNQMGAFQGTSHLLQLGHRNVGMINGPETTNSSRNKFEGYREALISYGLEPNPLWLTNCNFTFESGYQAAQSFLSMKERPTALFVSDDPIAIGAIKAFKDAGLSVPGDMAIVGYGNSPTGQYISPDLTTVDVFQKKLGVHGAVRLLDLIEKRRKGEVLGDPYRFVHSTQLIARGSCGMNTN